MSSPQPQWITPAGSLGTWSENVYYSLQLQAEADNQSIFYRLIAGNLPAGVQITPTGNVEGLPRNIVNVRGVPQEVAEDVTSRFAIRAFTQRVVDGQTVIDRLADRTFEITVSGQSIPEFITPAGNIGTFFDGTEIQLQIRFTDPDPSDIVRASLIFGELPPGLILDPVTGVISGVIAPLVGPPGTAPAGYDVTTYEEFPFDFSTRSASKNYQFAVEITDGKDSNVRTFEIFVYSKDSMSADTTDFTADNTFITADVVPARTPILLTPAGDLGRVRADNFFAFQFKAIDFDGDLIEFDIITGSGQAYDETLYDQDGIGFDRGVFSLPPGLQIDSDTGWFYGYIPDQGASEFTYRFAIRVRKKDQPGLVSEFTFFTITIIGDIDTEVLWLTPPNLGTISNGAISTLAVAAINTGGRSLQYRLAPGLASKLPQGLTLQSSGHITGRVSFNTFALDGGTTAFDQDTGLVSQSTSRTTFDLQFKFTVNAFSSQAEQIGYRVSSIVITSGGSGYTSQPTVVISAPPTAGDAIQATAGVITIVGGVITSIALGNPGRGYVSAPIITITGGGGTGASATALVQESTLVNPVSVLREFTVAVNRQFNEPYESLYIQCMPSLGDRALIEQLVQNQDIIPANLVYRADDPNFGVANRVTYVHAYGLTSATIAEYVSSLDLNHYWKNLVLGPIRTAQARDALGRVIYEVVYSEIKDDLVNTQGESVGKSVNLPFDIPSPDGSSLITTVYPNSLINMRDQVIDTVGQVSPALPLWMISTQQDGRVLGFTPAWVIAYLRPGESARVAYNIRTRFGDDLNLVDFEVDRYILDRSQTHRWDNSITDINLSIINVVGNGTRVTVTFSAQSSVPFTANQPIMVSGTGSSGFNGYYYIETCTETQLTFLSPKTGNWTSGGIVAGQGYWIPQPPAATVFDQPGIPPGGPPATVFDGNDTEFIMPADRWVATDEFNRYLVFPKRDILQ